VKTSQNQDLRADPAWCINSAKMESNPEDFLGFRCLRAAASSSRLNALEIMWPIPTSWCESREWKCVDVNDLISCDVYAQPLNLWLLWRLIDHWPFQPLVDKRGKAMVPAQDWLSSGPDLPIGYIGLNLGSQDPRGLPANCGTHRINCLCMISSTIFRQSFMPIREI